jgi:protein-S-isoprenylcysteine O-methyltransferase Ste14
MPGRGWLRFYDNAREVASLFLLAGGTFLKNPTWLGSVLTVSTWLFLYFSAITEEKECLKSFGPAYEEYMRRTKRFIPLLF